jgi:hypothetical protein
MVDAAVELVLVPVDVDVRLYVDVDADADVDDDVLLPEISMATLVVNINTVTY